MTKDNPTNHLDSLPTNKLDSKESEIIESDKHSFTLIKGGKTDDVKRKSSFRIVDKNKLPPAA